KLWYVNGRESDEIFPPQLSPDPDDQRRSPVRKKVLHALAKFPTFILHWRYINSYLNMVYWLILVVILLLFLIVRLYYPYVFKAFRLTILRGRRTADPYDLEDFEHRTIEGRAIQPWPEDRQYNQLQFSED